MKQTLREPSLLKVSLPTGETTTGGSQEWYTDQWRRMSGCGPTVAANIVWYLARSRPEFKSLCEVGDADQASFLRLMLEMFDYITPGPGGVNRTHIFTHGAVSYGDARGVSILAGTVEVPGVPRCGAGSEQIRDFIMDALGEDLPVAFLNLSNGSLTDLEGWHWVTIIGLEPESMTASVCDQGRVFDIDLGLWLKTTMLGGGLVKLFAE